MRGKSGVCLVWRGVGCGYVRLECCRCVGWVGIVWWCVVWVVGSDGCVGLGGVVVWVRVVGVAMVGSGVSRCGVWMGG